LSRRWLPVVLEDRGRDHIPDLAPVFSVQRVLALQNAGKVHGRVEDGVFASIVAENYADFEPFSFRLTLSVCELFDFHGYFLRHLLSPVIAVHVAFFCRAAQSGIQLWPNRAEKCTLNS